MIPKFSSICLFFIFYFNMAYSQSDSTGFLSDSIVFVSDTVIIKSTYYLPKSTKDSLDRYAGIGYIYGKSIISPNTANAYSSVSCINVYIGRKVKNLYANIGIGIMYMVANSYSTFSKVKQNQSRKTVSDTIDTYYQMKNGVLTPVYVTEPKDVTTVYTYRQDSTVNNKIKLTYFQIPFNISYLFSIKKINIGPQLGIKTCFLLTNVNSYPAKNIHSFIVYANAGLSAGYQVSKKLLIEADINHQFSLSKSSAESIGTLPFQNIGLSAKYFF